MTSFSKPVAWSIAASDPGGGAGVQADIKTMNSLGVHACAVISALTAQNTRGVFRVESVGADWLRAQVEPLLTDLPPRAIKLGALGGAANICATAGLLAELKREAAPCVVCDPVLAATSGATFADAGAVAAYREKLFPLVDILTPNLDEAAVLLGRRAEGAGPDELHALAAAFIGLGVKSVLIKGGHRRPGAAGMGEGLCGDYFFDGREAFWIVAPRQDVSHTHGAGCTLSAAIAAGVARGLRTDDALVLARTYVNQGLRLGGGVGQGRGPLAHGPWPTAGCDLPWIVPGAVAPGERLRFPALDGGAIGLYPIVASAAWVERLAALGVRTIQLRIKHPAAGADLEGEVRTAAAAARKYGARLFVNDHWRLALQHGVHGVHLGHDDLPHADLPALAAAGLRLGLSTHNLAEMARALALIPSYLAIGAVYPTTSKGPGYKNIGLENFLWLRALAPVPVVAIGGIGVENAAPLARAGVSGLAVISDIVRAPDVARRIGEWNAFWKKFGESPEP